MLLSSGVLIWFDSSAYPNYLVMKFHFFTFKEKNLRKMTFTTKTKSYVCVGSVADHVMPLCFLLFQIFLKLEIF